MCELGLVTSFPSLFSRRSSSLSTGARSLVALSVVVLVAGCVSMDLRRPPLPSERPLTASRALGHGDPAREASLRLVIAGLDDDEGGSPSRAVARYQRAIQVDSTNAFAYLALARHNLEYGDVAKAGAFLDQARSLFEADGQLGPAVDVWGIGLRAGIDRGMGRHSVADGRFDSARELSPDIWADERLSAGELR